MKTHIKMKTYIGKISTGINGLTIDFKFQAPENATEEQIDESAWQEAMANIGVSWEEKEGEAK